MPAMSRVVVFGTSQWADLALHYLTHDSPHEVVGFTVDREYLDSPEFRGLPVCAWEEIESVHPPGDVSLFLPISFKRMNHLRAERFAAAKEMGYELISYVSSKATTFSDFSCGENCFILEDNTIQPFVEIGDDVVMWSGNHIGHHTRIGDHVMITSHVVISGVCRVEDYSFFGVNATVRDETVIGRETVVGMGVTILADTEPFSVYKAQKSEPAGFRSDELRSLSHKSQG
jgi:sugar O-acyltransferase (sialic acid O-acetyltransferase NeuD family)